MSLVLDDVSLRVGADDHISHVNLTLERGTMNVLLGPTLAGKTTLMRLIAGLERPTGGRVTIDGKDTAHIPVRRRSVAMVYQQFVNYPSLSVRENIASPLRVARVARDEIDRRVAEAAKLLRLEPMLNRLPAQLSGGQQQRTAIARALVKQAELVLLDEPLANLDYKLREELREELPRIFGRTGAILIYATTEPGEALLLRGRTATMAVGRVTQVGDTVAIYRAPANIAAARVFSDPPLNEFAIEVRGGALLRRDGAPLGGGGRPLDVLRDGSYHLCFRVEHAALGGADHGGIRFPGHVIATQMSGGESFVHVEAAIGRVVALVRGVHEWAPGAPVEVEIDSSSVFVFDTNGERVVPQMSYAAA